MISLVIVSHSAKLAEGVCDLVRQATQNQVVVAAAGGLADSDSLLGTDAMRILAAIESVYSPDGVIVLMDLGSALISAETALEFLPDEQRTHVYLCSAPLVEGAFSAATQATATNDVQQIIAEAQAALTPKRAQLADFLSHSVVPTFLTVEPTALKLLLTIRNKHGLHARPAAQFVMTASQFQATVTLTNLTTNSLAVNGKSINQVAMLGVQHGHEILIKAAGDDAVAVLAALKALAVANFGESDQDFETVAAVIPQNLPIQGNELLGIPVSPGIAIGPVQQYRRPVIEVVEQTTLHVAAERERLEIALQTAQAQIQQLYQQTLAQVGGGQAAIFQAHLLFLADPTLVEATHQEILTHQINAASAWQRIINQMVVAYRHLADSYMQARAADVWDVGQRVLKLLIIDSPQIAPKTVFTHPVILIAPDLIPSDTADLDPSQVLGICTELGSATSHSAILARSLGIPAIVGLGESLGQLEDGRVIAFDGQQGRVWLAPTEAELSELHARHEALLQQQQTNQAMTHKAALTLDGHQVEVVANIGSLKDVAFALAQGAEGVGLLRSEFLYLDRQTAPSEDEQFTVYQAIAEALGARPLIIRTLDIGGDKPLPYLHAPHEDNPFLGWRGLRIGLDQPDMLKTQLRAILRTSVNHQLKIMFPMVSTVSEIRAAKVILAEAQSELRQQGVPFAPKIDIGVMVEVPAAVATADQLAREVDFFSIGTNDLSQYTMAADRTNPKVARLADALQPAVLRLIRQTIMMAHAAGIWVGVCGELAGNPLATPILLGLGVDEFSMSAPSIPQVKQAIRQFTVSQAQAIAETVLNLDSAEAVRSYLVSCQV